MLDIQDSDGHLSMRVRLARRWLWFALSVLFALFLCVIPREVLAVVSTGNAITVGITLWLSASCLFGVAFFLHVLTSHETIHLVDNRIEIVKHMMGISRCVSLANVDIDELRLRSVNPLGSAGELVPRLEAHLASRVERFGRGLTQREAVIAMDRVRRHVEE